MESLQTLIDKYFDRVQIEEVDYKDLGYVVENTYLRLSLPFELLRGYSELKGLNDGIPDATDFYIETDLLSRLRRSNKSPIKGQYKLDSILDNLDGQQEIDDLGRDEGYIEAEFQTTGKNTVKLELQRIPGPGYDIDDTTEAAL